MIQQLDISPATEADIPALNQLVNSAYRGESSRKGWTTEADLLDGVRTSETDLQEMLRRPNAEILTSSDDGSLLGCVYLELKKNELYLGMLTVRPDSQDRGIGKQLMAAAERYALDNECVAVTMTVISSRHELIAWYERQGFRQTGETQPFPDDPRFGLPRKPLEFVVLKKPMLLEA